MNLYVYLQGGLGNQMFQYAAGLSAMKEYNQFTSLKLDASSYEGQEVKVVKNGLTGRKFDLDVFGIDDDIETAPEGSTMLQGWFQNIKEFSNVEDLVRNVFKFKVDFGNDVRQIEKEICSEQAPVAIHVRRGDFLYNPNCNKFHGVLQKDYYDKAIKLIENKISPSHYYVFSEDVDWCKKNLVTDYPITFVDSKCNDYKDTGHLYLMSLCKAHIIANSTFSWWGAWLAKSQFVVGPKTWNQGGGSENIMENLGNNWVQV
jgi:hypothetical protein